MDLGEPEQRGDWTDHLLVSVSRRTVWARLLAFTACALMVACSDSSGGQVQRFQQAAQVATSTSAFQEMVVAQERAVAECMRDLGFDYEVPTLSPSDADGVVGASLLMDDPETAAADGYGNVESVRRFIEVRDAGVSANDIENLPDQQRNAFVGALYGEEGGSGCLAAGQAAAPDAQLMSTFVQSFNELHERVAADPRWVEANLEWSECMRAAGYDVADQLEARRLVTRRIEEEVGNPNAIDEQGRVALADIGQQEREIAEQDASCQLQGGEAFEEVWTEYTAEFVDDNPDLVDSLADDA